MNLAPAQASYPGTSSADIYRVDSAADSTLAALDRIRNFNVAEGDRVDFSATAWTIDDFDFRTFGSTTATPWTRLDGPGDFSLRIDKRLVDLDGAFIFGSPSGVIILDSAQATYPGTAGADIYVVDSATDSTVTATDRITSFDVAGDRVDFTATGWNSDDFRFRRFNVGNPSEFTRLDGPDGFELRINERLTDLGGAFVFADDALV